MNWAEICGTIHYLLNGENPQDELARLCDEVRQNTRIHLFTGAAIEKIEGSIGNFQDNHLSPRRNHRNHSRRRDRRHGRKAVPSARISVWRGPEGHDTARPRTCRSPVMASRRGEGNRPAKTVVMIQCVGSRDSEQPYCSRVCCAEAIKNALKIKALSPETNVYVLYRDIRTYGFKESYYTKARQQGVVFVRYDEDRKPEVARNSQDSSHRLRPDTGDADDDLGRPGRIVCRHSSS